MLVTSRRHDSSSEVVSRTVRRVGLQPQLRADLWAAVSVEAGLAPVSSVSAAAASIRLWRGQGHLRQYGPLPRTGAGLCRDLRG
jgi:hypothetical protein